MSEELVLLKEYVDSLKLDISDLTTKDLILLAAELKEAGEMGLARLVMGLESPQELLEYIGEEE